MMMALSGAPSSSALSWSPIRIRPVASKSSTVYLSSPLHHPRVLSPFVPEVKEAAASLNSEFRDVDNLVAHNTSRVLKAFQNAHVGSHFFAGCTGYGHDEAGGREGLDQAFAEIFGAESAIVRSQVMSFWQLRVLLMTLWRKSLESETVMDLDLCKILESTIKSFLLLKMVGLTGMGWQLL